MTHTVSHNTNTAPEPTEPAVLQAHVAYQLNKLNYMYGTLVLTNTSLTFIDDNNKGMVNLPLNQLKNAVQLITMLGVKLGRKWYNFEFADPEVQAEHLLKTVGAAGVGVGTGTRLGATVGTVAALNEIDAQINLEQTTSVGQFIAKLKATGLSSLQFKGYRTYNAKTAGKWDKPILIFGIIGIGGVILLGIVGLIAKYYNF